MENSGNMSLNRADDLVNSVLDAFYQDAASLGIPLSKGQLQQFLLYYELLIEWNQRFNLTAITDVSEVFKKHFVDSLTLVKVFPGLLSVENPSSEHSSPLRYSMENQSIENHSIGNHSIGNHSMENNSTEKFPVLSLIDVGSGAGFPGIPLKIAFPCLQVVLLDSLKKRINFLNEVISTLHLTRIIAVHARAEELARQKQHRECYDLCVSRAVAPLSVLSEYCLPYVKPGGFFIAYKTTGATEEIQSACSAISILGGHIQSDLRFQLPDSDINRRLVLIDKLRPTPAKYPRKAGTPSKDPLM